MVNAPEPSTEFSIRRDVPGPVANAMRVMADFVGEIEQNGGEVNAVAFSPQYASVTCEVRFTGSAKMFRIVGSDGKDS